MKVIYPQIDESRVRKNFQRGLFNRKKEIVRVEINYLPCFLFELYLKSKRGMKAIQVICDSIRGKVRRMRWPQPLTSSSFDSQETFLDEAAALARVKEEFRWLSFRFGLRMQNKYSLESVISLGKIGYPFWVIYYKRNGNYNFSICDGLSGKKEDLFAKEIFLELFGLRRKEEGDV